MKLLLFDVDGTLILSGGAGLRALDRAFAKRHNKVGATEILRLGGRTDPWIVHDLYRQHLGLTPDAAETRAFLDDYLVFLEQEVPASQSYRLMPGLPDVLEDLEAQGYVVGLATGNVRAGARLKLARGGLWSRFSFGGFGDDSADRGELVQIAATRAPHRFAPDDIWVIGDTPLDVAAARAAGFRALAVATGGYTADDLRAARPDVLLETLERLMDAW